MSKFLQPFGEASKLPNLFISTHTCDLSTLTVIDVRGPQPSRR